jgi:hypothetical protein
MTYFRYRLPDNYRRRWCVLRLCSEWEEVEPHRSNNQGDLFYHQFYSLTSE